MHVSVYDLDMYRSDLLCDYCKNILCLVNQMEFWSWTSERHDSPRYIYTIIAEADML